MADKAKGNGPKLTKKELRLKEREEIKKLLLIKILVGEQAAKILDRMEDKDKSTLANTQGFLGGYEMYLQDHIDIKREMQKRFKRHIELVSALSGKKPVEVIEAALRDMLLYTPIKKLQEIGIVEKDKPARKPQTKAKSKVSPKKSVAKSRK